MTRFPHPVKFDDRAVYFPSSDCLALADLHLGRTERHHDGGAYPRPEYETIDSRVSRLLNEYEPETVVLNGDVFQDFPFAEEGVDLLERLYDRLDARDATLAIVEGNHEELVGGFGDALPGDLVDHVAYTVNDPDWGKIVFTHGHHTPTTPADLFVIGHLHPVVREGGETRPCYLYGKGAAYETDVLVLPAFSTLVGSINARNPPPSAGHCPLINDGDSLLDYEAVPLD